MVTQIVSGHVFERRLFVIVGEAVGVATVGVATVGVAEIVGVRIVGVGVGVWEVVTVGLGVGVNASTKHLSLPGYL